MRRFYTFLLACLLILNATGRSSAETRVVWDAGSVSPKSSFSPFTPGADRSSPFARDTTELFGGLRFFSPGGPIPGADAFGAQSMGARIHSAILPKDFSHDLRLSFFGPSVSGARGRGTDASFATSYSIYNNMEILLELGYTHFWFDSSGWMLGAGGAGGGPPFEILHGNSLPDAGRAGMFFKYSF